MGKWLKKGVVEVSVCRTHAFCEGEGTCLLVWGDLSGEGVWGVTLVMDRKRRLFPRESLGNGDERDESLVNLEVVDFSPRVVMGAHNAEPRIL